MQFCFYKSSILFLFTFLIFTDLCHAREPGDCFDKAAYRYGITEKLLRSIAIHESAGNPSAVHRNKNGSEDIGIMQINSSWLPRLNRLGIRRRDLFSACTNEQVGAWILAMNIARNGKTWRAVGAYNAASPAKQERYARAIFHIYYSPFPAVSAAHKTPAHPAPTGKRSALNALDVRVRGGIDVTTIYGAESRD